MWQQKTSAIGGVNSNIRVSGWWHTYPSEKYEFYGNGNFTRQGGAPQLNANVGLRNPNVHQVKSQLSYHKSAINPIKSLICCWLIYAFSAGFRLRASLWRFFPLYLL